MVMSGVLNISPLFESLDKVVTSHCHTQSRLIKAQNKSDVLEVGLYDMTNLATRDGLLVFTKSIYYLMYGCVIRGDE